MALSCAFKANVLVNHATKTKMIDVKTNKAAKYLFSALDFNK